MKAEAGAGYESKRARTDQDKNVTFGEEGQGLLSSFLANMGLKKGATGAYEQLPSDTSGIAKRQAVIDSLSTPGGQVDKNALLDAIRTKSDAQTQVDIAQGRSKFYNKPTGRNDINLADTVSRNAATRDAALASTGSQIDQFNAQQEAQRRSQAAAMAMQADPASQEQQRRNTQILQALGLLAGEQSKGLVDQDNYNVDTKLTGNLFGGICWVAREVYGVDNPNWLIARSWFYTKAPSWLFKLYLENGEALAFWLKDKPKTKKVVKFLLDRTL